MDVRVSARVTATEDSDKVTTAILNLFPRAEVRQQESRIIATTTSLDHFKTLLEKQKIKTQIDTMSSQKFQEFKKFLDFMAKSKDGEEFLLHVTDAGKLGKIKKFKNVETKILPQDWTNTLRLASS